MIKEKNPFFAPASFSIPEEITLPVNLDFKQLVNYAKYLLRYKLDEFAETQLLFSKEVKLPVLKFFENFSEAELVALSRNEAKRLLSCCADNKTGDYVTDFVERWVNNQMPMITKSQIITEDITFMSYIRRKLFKHFITGYTTDIRLSLQILNEIDLFTAYIDSVCFKTLIEMQQQLFSQAQSLSHIGNWHWDLKTKKLVWSDEIYRFYELKPQSELVSEKISLYTHIEDMELVDHNMQLSIETLQPHDFFYRIILKGGRLKTLHAKGQVKTDDKGIPIEMFGTLQDVTEQKEKEKQLDESKKFAEKIADVSPCVISVYNVKSGKYIFLNKGLQTLLGYKPEKFLNKGRAFFYTLVHADDAAFVKEKNNAAIKEANSQNSNVAEQITEFNYRIKHKDGSYKWIRTFTTVFNRDKDNKVQDMLNVSMDITESHMLTVELAAINEEIKQKELQHQRMISEVEDYAIILLDKDGFIQNWNKGAEKIKGYPAKEIIGKNFKIFYRQEDRDRKLPESLIEQAIQTGKASHEGWRLRKDATMFWGSIVITALHDDQNNLIGFTKVTRNLTERKLAEDRLREYANHIEKHNAELQRINKDLDSFTYMASHDLQEPLRKIKTFCNMISNKGMESLSAEVSGYFERIVASVNRMQTLIDSLLNYSRATTHEVVLHSANLNEILEDVKKDLAETIEEKKVKISYGELPQLKIEKLQFHQLFCNLIENAVKYRRENVFPEIKIAAETFFKHNEAEEKAKFYRITVSDNGIGFEQKHAENIFKLFQRLHGRSEYSGTGIGLAICKKIVENHKGTIKAVSEPNKGTTFIIELPANE